MSVQHILPASQSITNNTPSIPSTSSAPAPASRSAQPSKTPTKVPKAKPNGPAAPKGDEKPAGLQLLARLSKPAQPKEKHLLEKQKANLAKSGAGGALLSRLQGSPNSHASAKTKGRVQKLSTGNAKVGRAKGKAGKDAMDVDKAVATKPKPKVKTQAELDEEMRAYERARRFA
ncbi:uncharacterized protein L201_006792 [Kwoniella dendrophila CBS 6074]|uniref:Chromatin target of PRMT1 protein C-terminal domain-containing protein n=1 Tax=Kwoniella dendrophila CBS 6074 TaxID=1295534 RepID=A0AAX4K4Y6_9TREE